MSGDSTLQSSLKKLRAEYEVLMRQSDAPTTPVEPSTTSELNTEHDETSNPGKYSNFAIMFIEKIRILKLWIPLGEPTTPKQPSTTSEIDTEHDEIQDLDGYCDYTAIAVTCV
ncbi:hypothetical protein KIN20_024722 [Parelaphostrongylus tenuis]|uniref:Uncharacterized protein n=1 Tax=Parelaphostrongylus tenuis TaxID=148309 RepID=A0AAD5QWG4_PARTN|nr:hypothetical protein KIN20_024722 [Parelaphostrongylus tenuis]